MMYGAEDNPVDIGKNDSSGVGGLLDGAEDDLVDIGENDNGSVGIRKIQDFLKWLILLIGLKNVLRWVKVG